MLTAKMVKDCAIEGGADICGIAGVGRFRDGPKETQPAQTVMFADPGPSSGKDFHYIISLEVQGNS